MDHTRRAMAIIAWLAIAIGLWHLVGVGVRMTLCALLRPGYAPRLLDPLPLVSHGIAGFVAVEVAYVGVVLARGTRGLLLHVTALLTTAAATVAVILEPTCCLMVIL